MQSVHGQHDDLWSIANCVHQDLRKKMAQEASNSGSVKSKHSRLRDSNAWSAQREHQWCWWSWIGYRTTKPLASPDMVTRQLLCISNTVVTPWCKRYGTSNLLSTKLNSNCPGESQHESCGSWALLAGVQILESFCHIPKKCYKLAVDSSRGRLSLNDKREFPVETTLSWISSMN